MQKIGLENKVVLITGVEGFIGRSEGHTSELK